MSDLGHFGEYDEYLRLLGDAQRYKLRKNRHKGFLGDINPETLLEKIKEEIHELEDAIARSNKIEMILEAADIANFAMAAVIAAMGVEKNVRTGVPGSVVRTPVVGGQDHQDAERGGTQFLRDDVRGTALPDDGPERPGHDPVR